MKQKIMAVIILIFCFGFYLQAQQNPPKITLVPVAGPVYMLSGGGGNIGLVADAAGMFNTYRPLDDGWTRVAKELPAARRRLGH